MALHLNGDAGGEDIVIFAGDARIVAGAPPAHEVPAMVQMYRDDLKSVQSVEDFTGLMCDYSVAIRVTPTGLRGS